MSCTIATGGVTEAAQCEETFSRDRYDTLKVCPPRILRTFDRARLSKLPPYTDGMIVHSYGSVAGFLVSNFNLFESCGVVHIVSVVLILAVDMWHAAGRSDPTPRH